MVRATVPARITAWLGSFSVVVGCSAAREGSLIDYGPGPGGSDGSGMSAPSTASGGQGVPAVGGAARAGARAPQTMDSGMMHRATDAAGTAGATTEADGADGSVHSTTPGDNWGPGDYPPDIASDTYLEISGIPGQGDYVRQYKVHVPPGYDPSVPAPVVFCIHGLGQDAVLFCVYGAEMNTKSDEAGFVLVMPNGYANSWNAGTCCGDASTEQLDDVALFRAIFAEVGQHVNIDHSRVYAMGFSNGGYMSYRLACEAADIFVAIAPGAGAIGTNDIGGGADANALLNLESDFVNCTPSQPVSVLDTHGTDDGIIPYSVQAPTITRMAMNNGCASTSGPAPQPPSAGDTTCVSYEDCPLGIELTACTITGGGHCWFGSPDCGTGAGDLGLAFVGANSDTMKNTQATWDFLKRQSR